MKVFIKGLNSCAMRKGKLQQYLSFLIANGHKVVNKPQDSDSIILWTCGFRADTKDNSLQEIKRYQREYKARLIVAGCLPDIIPEWLKDNFKVFFNHGNPCWDWIKAKSVSLSPPI